MLIPEMNEWRSSEIYTDIVIEIDGTRFPCHRVALATASRFFYAMLKDLPSCENPSQRIPLQKVMNAETFGEVLQFIYTDAVTITMENVYHLLAAANFLMLKPQLEKDCTDFITNNLPNQHMFCAASFAKTTGRPVLLYNMADYISCHLGQFYQTSDFLESPLDVIKMIIDTSTLGEEIVVSAVIEWIYHKRKERWQYFSQLSRLGMMACVPRSRIESMAKSLIPDGISNQDVASHLEQLRIRTSSDETLRVFWIFRNLDKHDMFRVTINHTVDCKILQTSDSRGGMKKVAYGKSFCYCLNFFNDDRTLERGFLEFCLCARDGKKLRKLKPPMEKTGYKYFVDNFHLSGLPNVKQIYLYQSHVCSLNVYNCDTDEWAEMKLEKKGSWATMATCETSNTVYLVGGRMQETYLQAYDCCTKTWRKYLPNPNHQYCGGAVICTFDGKLYVYNDDHRQYEIYVPSTNKWYASKPNPHVNAAPAKRIVAYGDELWLFLDARYTSLEDAHIVFLYRPRSDCWRKYPGIVATMKQGGKSFDFKPRRPRFLDAFVF